MLKVRQLYNKNQFLLESENEMAFQSYESTIAVINKKNGLLTFGRDWDYSNTTKKHLYLFLNDWRCLLNDTIYNKLYFNGFKNCSNKRQFLQKLINEKIIKIDYNL